METELDELTELAAHLYSAREIAMRLTARQEQRLHARLKKARQRTNAPTTLPAYDDGPALERRTA